MDSYSRRTRVRENVHALRLARAWSPRPIIACGILRVDSRGAIGPRASGRRRGGASFPSSS